MGVFVAFIIERGTTLVHERENYASLLRKNNAQIIITQRRQKYKSESNGNIEEIQLTERILNQYNPDLTNEAVPIV